MAIAKKDISTERTLGQKDTYRLVKGYIAMKRPVFIAGQPGVGKSDIIRQIAKEEQRDVFDVRLLLMTEVDVRGIPYYNSKTNTMDWAPPSVFPLKEDSTAIIFLDEITQASPSVQAAALQLVLERRIGDYIVPEGVAIVAAGNRASDKTGAKPMIKALANRFSHVTLEAKFKDWQEWAILNDVHEQVVAFLTQKQEYFNQFDALSPHNAFPTPRSWVDGVSKVLQSGVFDDLNEEDDLLLDVVAGAVGESAAREFIGIRKLLTELPLPSDILEGKIDKPTYNEVAGQFSTVISCSHLLRQKFKEIDTIDEDKKVAAKDDFFKQADNYLSYCLRNFQLEVTVMAINLAIKTYQIEFNHKKMPSYSKFYSDERNSKILRSAMNVL